MAKKILIVDDNISITRPLQAYLRQQGYETAVADNGENALYTARYVQPDVILLDIMMPVLNGYEFTEKYRQEADTPIIFVSAKLEEFDKVKGLQLGADDYVTKPIAMAELVARIEAVLRRYNQPASPSKVLRVAGLVLNKQAQLVQVDGNYVDLTPAEFALLERFMRHPLRTFSRLELLDDLGESDASERIVDYHIANLRKKIGDKPRKPRYIETVFAKGYRLREVD